MHKHASTNRFFRLVWSHVHSCWVAVAEGARGRGKSASRKLSAALIGALAANGALAGASPGDLAGMAAPMNNVLPATNALPTGPQVVAGQASVTSASSQMTVQQGTDKAILNWQSFDIGANAGVRFVQPSANAVALNRVTGPDPSRIYGQLSSNGKVFLVNPNGVLFGASARVDVGSLVASSLALPDGEFLAGRYTFSGTGGAGAVRNEGSIHTANGGYVALLGPSVGNRGSIVAPGGSVALGAGEQVGVDLRGDGLITLRVERGAVQALAANHGLIQADGGRVELTARGADALARASVNNEGLVQARGLVSDGGSIRLTGDGDVRAGALDVSSTHARGGQVSVEGKFVALDGGIDAAGAQGGSVVVHAAATLSTAAATSAAGRDGTGGSIAYRSGGSIVESSSAVADADGTHGGGSIAVHGDAGVLSSASYSARSSAGEGGRIDVSGADLRLLGAQLDASGNTQGGLVRVGGAFQGGAVRADAPDLARFVTRWGGTAPIANASDTFINDSTAIRVDATGAAGQGGTAVVWSDKQTTMLGSIDARGAAAAGTVEISSKDELRHVGLERIALGAGGQLLLDPKNITIGSSAGAWTYQAILGKAIPGTKATNVAGLDEYDSFGYSVALNAAGDRLAVGTPYDDGADGSGIERGAVHLFSFTNTEFAGATLQGTIGSGYTGGKNLNVALLDLAQFGSSVAFNANATRLAVGALGDNEGLGSVRLFSFADGQFGTPSLTSTLGLAYGTPNLDNAASFGSGVALNAAGDRLAVGALGDAGASGSCGSCGAVYLFDNALGSPGFVKAIGAGYNVNMNLASSAQFGTSVAFDANGNKLAVGAYGVNGSRGAVYLFDNAYGSTSHVATLGDGFTGGKNLHVASGINEGFGSSVAFNSSGSRLAVGAIGAGGGNGNVRIIDFTDTAFSGAAIKAVLGSNNTEGANAEAGLETGENFGSGVALNGAGDRLVAGSPFGDGDAADDNNEGYGAVRAFALMPAAATNLAFGNAPAADATIDAAMLRSALDSGTSITLQANNDITLNAGNAITVLDGSGNGSLALQAGRSIVLNSSIATGNADLTLVANQTTANGVVSANRDAGAAGITVAAGTTIDAGSGQVRMTIADGAGKANRDSGAIAINGVVRGGAVSLKNLGPSANSNVVVGAAGSIRGSGSGTIEVAVAGSGGGTFSNNAGTSGLDAGAGRYLVYSNNPGATTEGVSGYNKRYNVAYSGTAPGFAASGNWFLYSVAPVLNVSASAAGKVYNGLADLPALAYGATGFIDGDSAAILSGDLAVAGMTKNAGSYAITSGSLANSLGYTLAYTGATLTVTPRTLVATVAGVNKTYDGNTSAGVTFGDNRVAGDALALAGSASFADKHAGNGKTVNVSDIALSGLDAGNYQLASNTASTSASIFTRVLNATATGLNKTYDGGTSANVFLADDRVGGDVLQVSAGTASFADKNAGNGKAISVTGITVGGADAGNYTLASGSAATSANINRRNLTATVQGIDRAYDGTTAAQVSFGDNRVNGDVLSLTGSARFADKNAASGKAVDVSGIALGGVDAGNYNLVSSTAGTSANIAKRTLNVNATGAGKTYDGNTTAGVSFGDDRVNGDVLNYSASASFADKNAGSGKAIAVTGISVGGIDAGNYTLASSTATASADIARRALLVSASAADKVYDGRADATVTLGDDRVNGDALTLSGNAGFADKHAGDNKAVSVSDIVIDGADAANYTLASTSAATSARIARRTLQASVAALDKVYDGNTSVQFSMSDDRVAGDQLAVGSTAAGFADKHVGANKAVTVSSLTLSGQDAANYVLAASGGNTTASITPRTLTVNASGSDKVYDGTTAAGVTLGDDRVAGDLLALAHGAAAFGDKHAGAGKTVTVGSLALSGQDAANYRLASNTTVTTAAITPRALVVNASGIDKVYDGTTTAGVTLGDNRVNGDALTLSGNAGFADKHAGDNKAVSVTGIVADGADAANYTLASTSAATSASIARRTLQASVAALDKVYDGNTSVQFSMSDDRVAGDQLAVGSTAAGFADKHVGANKAVTVSSLTLSGQDAANYVLASTSGNTTASITPRTLTVNASGSDKVYDGTTAAGVTLGDDRVAGDLLALAHGAAAFGDKHAGAGKTVTVGSLALSGQDAANYRLASNTTATTAAITPRALVVDASGIDKVYDGTTTAGVTLGDNRLAGDQLSLGHNASFLDKNAGAGKRVSVGILALGGQDAANYALASSTLSTSAAITPKALGASIDGLVAKTYDGTSRVNLGAGQVVLDGFIAGEGARVGALEASFDNANVAQATRVEAMLAETSVTTDGSTLLSNYRLPVGVGGAAAITPKALAVTGLRAATKTYDGNTTATLADIGTLDGLVAGDSLRLTGPTNVRFATRGAGSGKLVTASGYGIADGATGLASNYALSGQASTQDGLIRQATLTVKANDATRVAGGANPVFGFNVSGLIAGDSPALLPEFVTATNAGPTAAPGSYAITVGTTATLDDYRMAFVDGVLTVAAAAITPVPVAPVPVAPVPVAPVPVAPVPVAPVPVAPVPVAPVPVAPVPVAPAPVAPEVKPAPAAPDLTRIVVSSIQPVLPGDATRMLAQDAMRSGGIGNTGNTGNAGAEAEDLPRVEAPRQAGAPARVPTQRADGAVITLSGGTEVLTRNGGLRTTE